MRISFNKHDGKLAIYIAFKTLQLNFGDGTTKSYKGDNHEIKNKTKKENTKEINI